MYSKALALSRISENQGNFADDSFLRASKTVTASPSIPHKCDTRQYRVDVEHIPNKYGRCWLESCDIIVASLRTSCLRISTVPNVPFPRNESLLN